MPHVMKTNIPTGTKCRYINNKEIRQKKRREAS